MNEVEIKAKLEQVFETLPMNRYQRNTLSNIISQAAKASIAGQEIAKITPLEEEDEIATVITAVNQIINAFK